MRAPTSATIADEARGWIDRLDRGDVRTRGGKPYKPSVARLYRATSSGTSSRGSADPGVAASPPRRAGAPGRQAGSAGLLRVEDPRRAERAPGCSASPAEKRRAAGDPVDGHLDLPPDSESRDRAASPAEAAALLAALPEEDRPLWATAFYAGLRRGELRALRCTDLNASRTEISVRRGWDDYQGEIEPKSKKGHRRVPVAGALRLILLEHLACTGRRGDDLVFGRTACDPFTPTHIRKRALGAWAATAVGSFLRGEPPALELDSIGLHECRHTFVSLMVAAGLSLEEVGDYVGHSSAYMTDRYRHLLDGARVEAAAALDALLAGNG